MILPKPLGRHSLAGAEVVVWDLDLARIDVSQAGSILPAHEVEVAQRALDPSVQRRRLAGRILVRTALAGWTGDTPEGLKFKIGPHGKPFLPEGPSFNVSHSGKFLAMVIRQRGRIGIDLELVRGSTDLTGLARRYFTATEQRELAGSEDGTLRAFFRVWVRKEAFLKATGFGLTVPLDSFSVSAAPLPTGANALIRSDLPHEPQDRWLVTSMDGPAETMLALAMDNLEPSESR